MVLQVPNIIGSNRVFKSSPNDGDANENQGQRDVPKKNRTKEFFIMEPRVESLHGTLVSDCKYGARQLETGGVESNFNFLLPKDFVNIKNVYVVLFAPTGENDWNKFTAEVAVNKAGESYNGTSSSEDFTPDIQADKIEEIDISTGSLFNEAEAGDYIGIKFINESTTKFCYTIGVRVIYD